MKRIKLNEKDIRAIIKEVVAESFKDKLNKFGSKIKNGWNKYEEWCNDGLEAENPSQIDFKEYGKETLKNIGSKVKNALDKYEEWCLSADEAENNAYIDGKELKQTLKNGVNRIGKGIKKGYQKAKQWMDDETEKTLNAPNPMFWGDDDDETNESLKRTIKESVRQAFRNNLK